MKKDRLIQVQTEAERRNTDSFRHRQRRNEKRQTHSETDKGREKKDRLIQIQTEEERR